MTEPADNNSHDHCNSCAALISRTAEDVAFLRETVTGLLESMNRMPAPLRAMLMRKANTDG